MDHSEDTEEGVPSSKSTSPGENEDQSKAQRTEKERPADQPLLQDDKDPDNPDDPDDPEDPEDPAVSAETINKIRPKFVNGVSIEILKQLIDLLLSEGVLSRPEKEDILEKNQTRADKARDFIDCVTKKGPEACRMMLKHLQSKDPTLSRHLGLYLDPTVRKGLLQTCQRQLKSNLTNRLESVFEGTATRGNSTLLNDIYTELFITEGETTEVNNEHEVVFIFDGLDEFRPSLNFLKTKTINDPRKTTSVKVLLTSLIRGNLLPSARVWITTRPAAANQIPPEYVDVVTEVRGFTDPQKEEYFRKRFRDESSKIISHIKTSRSIHIMCHIPVFCWITATVLEDVMKAREGGGLPKTLTEMYIHFLVVQTKLKKVKYDEEPATDQESRKMMEHLGKLAFEQLQKGHLIFYQSDLKESGINVEEAAVCSGVFTEIFKTVKGLYQDKAFCFIHLSVQEFLAALHVHLTFIESGVNLLKLTNPLRTFMTSKQDLFYQNAVDKALQSPNGHLDVFLRFLLGLSLETNQNHLQGMLSLKGSSHDVEKTAHCGVILLEDKNNLFRWIETRKETLLYRSALDKALQSPNGHLDLFLRFLLGLSLETNQNLLRGLLKPKQGSSKNNQETVGYIKKKISEDLSAEKSINLFHCLNELNEGSLVEEVQQSLRSGRLSTDELSPAQWSALVFILLSSEEDLEVFDLKKYSASEEVLLRLLPVVKASKKVLLSGCNLSEEVCAGLSSVLSSQSSSLTELDLSNNHLQDSGLEKLCPGLESPHCKLESLRLSGCNLSEEVCAGLSSVLSSQSSSLTELDLSNNHLQDSGLEKLCPGLESPHCKLESLRLSDCNLSEEVCAGLSSVLSSQSSSLKKLDLSNNHLQDSGLKKLCPGLESPHCKLESLRLSDCDLSEEVCAGLSSVLSSQSSSLTELDLSNNHLQDSGLEKLCPGLESPHCKLESLRLSGCLLTSDGCASLVSALSSNPSHLRELDLSYNHPGESAVKLLSAGLEDPRWGLDTLRVEPAGPRWLRPGLRKYSCQLSIDTNTVHKHIKLSDNNRKMTYVKEDQSYPDHPDRFDFWDQLLCREVLTGRCYWEVQWRGDVCISVSYRRIRRIGNSDDCLFGWNDHSWSLFCSDDGRYYVCHNNRRTPSSSSSSVSDRVAVYVDVPTGILSFYSVSSDRLIHLHTFNTTFTEPLYPGFGFRFWSMSGSSVSLCSV
ncbi:uncharacterized protein FYW49_020496 [Xenentodon cancila]